MNDTIPTTDAERYQFLRSLYLGADFDWGDPSRCVLIFQFDRAVSADLDATIDAAILSLNQETPK